MKKYYLDGNYIYCTGDNPNVKRRVTSLTNELNALEKQKDNLKILVDRLNKKHADLIYDKCKKVYGTCKDGSMEACLHANGYYQLIKGDVNVQ